MTKQEAIEKAYRDKFEELKIHIDENGWCKPYLIQDDDGDIIKCPSCNTTFNFSDTYYCINSLERCPNCKAHTEHYDFHHRFADIPEEGVQKRFGEWRPISLKGIENNNGWIKIESEDDLPKEYGRYWIVDKDNKKIYQREFNEKTKEFFYYYSTHYQPIIIPNKPIY